MERFCSKKSGSSSSAGQPALSASDPSGKKSGSPSTVAQPALSASDSSSSAALLPVGSAEQPVVQFKCLKDVRLWLATPEVLNGSLDVSAFKEALTVLARVPKPRKEEVRPLQSKWDVARRHEGKERPLPDVIRELEQKVVNAAHQLANSVPASAAQPAATCIASAAQPATSSSGQLAKKRKREHATAGNSAEPPASSTVEQAAPTDTAELAQPKPAQRQHKRTAIENCDSVEQPARAEQPEHSPTQGCESPWMVTLDDCKSWVDSLNAGAKPTQRISEAIAILQAPKSRKRRSDLQALCKTWAATQYNRNAAQKKQRLSELESELVDAVVRDTNRLKKLHAHHGSVSGVAAMLRTSASGGEQPEAENQDRQDSPRLADAAPGNAK